MRKTALLMLFSLVGGYTSAVAQERTAIDNLSGFWVYHKIDCKNGVPTSEYYVVGKWTLKKDWTSNNTDPTAGYIWGKGEFKLTTNTEWYCRLRQPKSVGNETSFRAQCEHEGRKAGSSEIRLSLSAPNEMDIKYQNKDFVSSHVFRCGAVK
jgi:hypothetical protein